MSRMPNCCLKFSSGSFSRSFSEVCSCSFWWCSFPPVLECFLKNFSEFFSLSLKQDERYLDWVCGVSCPWPHFCPFVLWSTRSQTTAGEQAEEQTPMPIPVFLPGIHTGYSCSADVASASLPHSVYTEAMACMKFRFPKMLLPDLFVLWSFLKSFTWGDLLHILQNGLQGTLFYQHLSIPAHFWGLEFLPRCSNTGGRRYEAIEGVRGHRRLCHSWSTWKAEENSHALLIGCAGELGDWGQRGPDFWHLPSLWMGSFIRWTRGCSELVPNTVFSQSGNYD